MLSLGLGLAVSIQTAVYLPGILGEQDCGVRQHLFITGRIQCQHRDNDGVFGIDDADGGIPVAVVLIDKAAVFLGDLILTHLIGQFEVVDGIGVEHAGDHVGEALLAPEVQGFEHPGDVAGRVVAVVGVVGAVIRLVHVGIGHGRLAPDLVARPVVQPAAHVVSPVVVGVGEDILLHRAQGHAQEVAFLVQFTRADLLGDQHHQRHLVDAAGIVPGVPIVEVLVPGLQVAVAEGDVLLLEIVLGDEGLHPAVQLLGVEDAVAPHLADLLGVFGSDLHRAVTLGHVRLIRVGGQGCRRKERKRQQQAQDRFSRSAQFHFHVASHPRGARTLL